MNQFINSFSTYHPEDVIILLKDITGLVKPIGTKERERAIQSGRHYSEMLPLEYKPTSQYLMAYYNALHRFAPQTAQAVAICAKRIYDLKGEDCVLVSLARAGTPIGILLKHYLKYKFSIDVPHYTISIIRGRGIDNNAMKYILQRHSPKFLQFVDGWTGKGAIAHQLFLAMEEYPEVDAGLAVLSDPAFVAEICGTHKDFLIASSCLNATVSGLLSRTFLRDDIIGPNDFHGAIFYKELIQEDLTYNFISAIEAKFSRQIVEDNIGKNKGISGIKEVHRIAAQYQIKDINLIKPGIGETTRVLLRRVPWEILVHDKNDNIHLGHIFELAKEKGVEVLEYPLENYLACGIIKNLADT